MLKQRESGSPDEHRRPDSPRVTITMQSPRTFPETLQRLALGVVGGGVVVGIVTLFSTTLWWVAAAVGSVQVGPVAAATVMIAFLFALPVINVVYFLQVNVHGDPEFDEQMELVGDLFPDLSSFLVSALYVNILVAVVVVLSSIGTVTALPGTLLAIGYVILDIEVLQRFERSPAAAATIGSARVVSAISNLRAIPVSELPVVKLQRAGY